MLIRDVLLKKHIMVVLIFMSASMIYSIYKGYKYSNCYISNFKLVSVRTPNQIIIGLPKGDKLREVLVNLNYKNIPSHQSDANCEKFMVDTIKTFISEQISSYNGVDIKLANCHYTTRETDGWIFINGRNLQQIMLEKKLIPEEKRFKFRKTDWCEYYAPAQDVDNSPKVKNKTTWQQKIKKFLHIN